MREEQSADAVSAMLQVLNFSRELVVGLFLFGALPVLQARGPSTPQERANVVALARSLERDPLGKNAPATRQWLREWVMEVPDIRVYVCDDLLGHGLGNNYPYSGEVKFQAMFSAAAFAIERQDKATDDIAQYTAGVEGALRVYEVLLKSKPNAKSAFLDNLLAKRDRSELADHIAILAKEKCKRSNVELIAAPVGAGVGFILGLLVARFGGIRVPRVTGPGVLMAANRTQKLATISQRIVFICVAYYLIVGIALHILEPEFDPRYRFMSEYVWGAYGWLMTTTFLVLGLAALAVAAGLRAVHQSLPSARIGFGILAVGGLFVTLAGIFKEFTLHGAASAVALPSFVMATLLLSWSFRHAQDWQPIYLAALLIAIAMFVALLSIVARVGMPGLQQRAFLFLFLLWLSLVAHRLVRVTTDAT
jgi:hypothetical membrane protein